MRNFFFFLFVLLTFKAIAQPLNNEWIKDYSKPYYKFKVGTTGLYRIGVAALTNINLQNTPAEQFQLWRNGVQVPIYTTVATGLLGSNDYIEFWGMRNDGKPDKYLYRDANNQLSDRVSLQTDTAAFFLTVNSNPTASNPNLHITDVANTIPATPPAPTPYFIYTQHYDFEDHVNFGYAQSVGEYVYSSAYDMGEFCSSPQITGANSLTIPVSNLNAAATGPAANLKAAFVATIYGNRSVQLGFNTDNTNVLLDTLYDLTPGVSSTSVPISTLVGNPNSLNIKVITKDAFDVVVCNYAQLTYPHTFNLGGQTSFSFSLPATSAGNFLQITNFNAGTATPVLYDFTNGVRYTANTSIAGTLQFQLPASATTIDFVLVSQDGVTGNISTVASFRQRTFTNYALSANQGDYLIISNKLLGLNNGGAVDAYRAYRSTPYNGSTYNPKVYDIDELEDQFAYGIKKHPLSIKNFIRYASSVFAKKPAFVFFIGKGVMYDQYRTNQSSPFADRLNLVPTWGNPASDAMLASTSLDPNPTIGFGRLSAVSEAEVNVYLSKVVEYEAQQNVPQTLADRAWMKNIIHITGADDASLYPILRAYMNRYQNIITEPFYGGLVYNFDKTTTGPVTAVASTQLISLINNGVSLITYFGHGSNTVLDYANINDPYAFNNKGKYPMFLTNGCSVGNFFDYDTMRMGIINTFSEKYIFAPNQGAIGVIGNSHFGLTNFLDTYSTGFYNSLSSSGYNKEVSNNMLAGIAALKSGGGGFSNYGTRIHAEETLLEGDPAIKIYASAKPDYVVEQQNVVINPAILSVSNTQFTLKAYLYNIGKATNDTTVSVFIQRVYPNGKIDTLFNKRIANFNYKDSVVLTVPIVGSRDKGTNQIIVTINNDKAIDEISFSNNSVTSSFAIFDNGITPIYPYNYAIVNKPNIQLIASTANPISPLNSYVMDIDTSALFISPLKTKTVSSIGGAISFDPGITLTDSTVYYWRVAQVPTSGAYIYTTSSFVYLNGSSTGFNQSHLYQHLQSSFSRMYLDSFSRRWMYLPDSNNIVMQSAVYDPNNNNQDQDFQTFVNGFGGAQSACVGHSLIFNVYDPVTLLPFYNQAIPSTTDNGHEGGFMSSATFCGKTGRQYNFEYQMLDIVGRRALKNFMDWIPSGYIVTARLNYDDPTPFVDVWKTDSIADGANNTLYSHLQSVGFLDVDSFNRARTFVLIYKKNTPTFKTRWLFSKGTADAIHLSVNLSASDTLGYVTSPEFGPSTSWKLLKWRGAPLESKPGDVVNINVVGVDNVGNQTQLMSLDNTKQDIDITGIDAKKYPYLKLMMRNADSINLTPYQLRYWRLIGDMVPEGAMAPNVKFLFVDTINKSNTSTDTFYVGETINLAVAFKNISDVVFRDSISVYMQVSDNNNSATIIPMGKLKKLASGDTALIYATIDASKFVGNNTLYINVNPNNSQPEQYHFNNFMYKGFYVTGNNNNPVLDVTFDGVHILNNDIVSSKPYIKIKLVDRAKYWLLNDSSLMSVKLVYPDRSIHPYSFNTDTLRFTPASANGNENAALIDFTPYLTIDGTYELIVTGKNRNGNPAGFQQYKVQFDVKNTPMISNVFNYPNPFTTSTAFVFTLTGSDVPQDMKIEILTITGKIVKEITKEQLGNIHIGNNITAYKWDGTDMFGAKLGNGVYLYRVVTKLNGNNLDKFTSSKGGTDTDQFFKGGYGKMYLLR